MVHRNGTFPVSKQQVATEDLFFTRTLDSIISWFSGVPAKAQPGRTPADWSRHVRSTPGGLDNGLGPGIPPRDDITMAEVRQHCTKEDAWMAFHGAVYNITPYLSFHPGGAAILLRYAGKDGSGAFMKQHPWVNMSATMGSCLVGRLALDPLQIKVREEIERARLLREEQKAATLQPAGPVPAAALAVGGGGKLREEVVAATVDRGPSSPRIGACCLSGTEDALLHLDTDDVDVSELSVPTKGAKEACWEGARRGPHLTLRGKGEVPSLI